MKGCTWLINFNREGLGRIIIKGWLKFNVLYFSTPSVHTPYWMVVSNARITLFCWVRSIQSNVKQVQVQWTYPEIRNPNLMNLAIYPEITKSKFYSYTIHMQLYSLPYNHTSCNAWKTTVNSICMRPSDPKLIQN